jgi:hypothetical protein
MTSSTAPESGETPAITGLFIAIPKRPGFHTYGWARAWADNLSLPLNITNEPKKEVYYFHGAHPWLDKLNIPDGYKPELRRKIENMLEAEKVWSLDVDMIDYASFLERRGDFTDHHLLPALREFQAKAKTIRHTDLGLDWLAVGDSHVAAWAPYRSMLVKHDGKTLWGELRKDFELTRAAIAKCPQIKGVTMVFGNIDLRFHILRLGVDWKKMYDQWKEFGDSLGIEVEYAVPWPIEFEGRGIPLTGCYKKQPFYGSRQERADLLLQIRDYMDKKGMLTVSYPEEWLDVDPEEFSKVYMQKYRNVHLSPEYYRGYSNWTLY